MILDSSKGLSAYNISSEVRKQDWAKKKKNWRKGIKRFRKRRRKRG